MAKNEAIEQFLKIITDVAMDSCKKIEWKKEKEKPFADVSKEYVAEKDFFGYRWYVDEQNKIYISRIRINSTFHNDFTKSGLLSFYTEDCTVTHIVKIPELTLVDEIPGRAKAYTDAFTSIRCGAEIQNQRTYFCLNLHDLIISEGLEINRKGKQIIIPLSPFEINDWIGSFTKRFNDAIGEQ